jgi:hypothetical protein
VALCDSVVEGVTELVAVRLEVPDRVGVCEGVGVAVTEGDSEGVGEDVRVLLLLPVPVREGVIEGVPVGVSV